MKVNASGLSHVGLKRKVNEDSYFIAPEMGIYVVADGMGGHKAGEVASRIVIETMKDYWEKVSRNAPPAFIEPVRNHLSDRANHLVNSISLANLIIHEAQKKPEYHRMGSTVSALLVDNDRIWSANVGDSGVYLLSHGQMKVISEEHSVVAEQKNLGLYDPNGSGPLMKNILTRAMGVNQKVETFITSITPEPGDIFLICSDGLTNFMEEESIPVILGSSLTLDRKANELIQAALNGGGGDNITVILVEVIPEGRWDRLKNRLKIQ